MSDYLADAAIRGAAIIPTVVVTTIAWFALRAFDAMLTMRRWQR